MTVFGVDIHPKLQARLNVGLLKGQGYDFLACKVTEGAYWHRPGYHTISATARKSGLLFVAYHFLRSEYSGDAQAAWTKKCMGADWGKVPVMLDWETSVSGTRAGPRHATDYINGVHRRGGRVTLNYLPGWYWSSIGKPNITSGPVGAVPIVQSSYGANPAGYGSSIYPGDHSTRWKGFGGRNVDILQFGSNMRIDGYSGPLDVNAFRGTLAELRAKRWFYDPAGSSHSTPGPGPGGTRPGYPAMGPGFGGPEDTTGTQRWWAAQWYAAMRKHSPGYYAEIVKWYGGKVEVARLEIGPVTLGVAKKIAAQKRIPWDGRITPALWSIYPPVK